MVAAVFVDAEGGYWLHACATSATIRPGSRRSTKRRQLCRQVAAFAAQMHLPAITIETNGLGRFLPALLRRELAAARVACAVVEQFSHSSKEQRILDAFDPLLAAGRAARARERVAHALHRGDAGVAARAGAAATTAWMP